MQNDIRLGRSWPRVSTVCDVRRAKAPMTYICGENS